MGPLLLPQAPPAPFDLVPRPCSPARPLGWLWPQARGEVLSAGTALTLAHPRWDWGLQKGRLEAEVGADGGPDHATAATAPFQPFGLGVSAAQAPPCPPGGGPRVLFSGICPVPTGIRGQRPPSRCLLQRLRRALRPALGAGSAACPGGGDCGLPDSGPAVASSPARPPGGRRALRWPGRSGCRQPQLVSFSLKISWIYCFSFSGPSPLHAGFLPLR